MIFEAHYNTSRGRKIKFVEADDEKEAERILPGLVDTNISAIVIIPKPSVVATPNHEKIVTSEVRDLRESIGADFR